MIIIQKIYLDNKIISSYYYELYYYPMRLFLLSR